MIHPAQRPYLSIPFAWDFSMRPLEQALSMIQHLMEILVRARVTDEVVPTKGTARARSLCFNGGF
jgi:hypothetical protein